MNTFKHSGAFGDLIYSLPIVKHFGGGEFYLHLNQIDWIGSHYYGSQPDPFHRGRLTQQDYEFMRTFMLAQPYITKFEVMDPARAAITHNLDRFRPVFVGHPDNYLNIYSSVFGLSKEQADVIASTPWLTVPSPRVIEGRSVVINRSQRWIPAVPGPAWSELREQGVEDNAVFVGLAQEYAAFTKSIGWDIPYTATDSMQDLAEVIAGADTFIGNQSQALALAVGLGIEDIIVEARIDMPMERNECFFPKMQNVRYI